MRITEDADVKKFVDDIEIPDADDIELAPTRTRGAVPSGLAEAAFAKGYDPVDLPKIELPDLPQDADSVSAQVLAQAALEIDDSDEEDPVAPLALALNAPVVQERSDEEILAAIQVKRAEADQRAEIMQARMGKLSGQISSLNDKLDRLANSSRIKV